MLDERFKTVFFDLFLAVKTKFLFNFKFNRKSVSIPTGFTKYLVAFHCTVTRNHILDNTR